MEERCRSSAAFGWERDESGLWLFSPRQKHHQSFDFSFFFSVFRYRPPHPRRRLGDIAPHWRSIRAGEVARCDATTMIGKHKASTRNCWKISPLGNPRSRRKRTASHHGARNNFSPKHFRDYMLYNKSVSDPETCLAKTNLPRGIKDNFVGTPKSRHHNKTKSEDESRERRKK